MENSNYRYTQEISKSFVTEEEEKQPIHLSSANFIKALSGKEALDEDKKIRDFFIKNCCLDGDNHENIVIIRNVVVKEKIIIGDSQDDDKEKTFPFTIFIIDCIFESVFNILPKVSFNSELVIVRSKFQSMFQISQANFEKKFCLLASDCEDEFYVDNCCFQDEIEVRGNFQRNFYISKSYFKSYFRVTGGTYSKEFKISTSTFHKEFCISGGNFKRVVNIARNNYIREFWITKGEFWKQIRLLKNTFKGVFLISGGHYHHKFNLLENKFERSFTIHNGNFNGKFHVLKCTIDCDVKITGGHFNESFHLDEGEFTCLFFVDIGISKKGIINHLIFDLSSFIQSKVIIEGKAKLQRLTFRRGISTSGMVYINPISLDELIFEDFANEGILEITGVKSISTDSKIQLIRSNLDGTVFKGVKFDTFGKIIIEDTKLNNISTIGSHFPSKKDKLGNSIIRNASKTLNPGKIAEVYNQLYLAMKNQGIRTWELEYYAQYLYWQQKSTWKEREDNYKEFVHIIGNTCIKAINHIKQIGKSIWLGLDLEIFRFILLSLINIVAPSLSEFQVKSVSDSSAFNILKQSFLQSISNIKRVFRPVQLLFKVFASSSLISLWFNKITTNYGRSWLQGIIGTLIITWLFYLVYIYYLPEIVIGWQYLTWNNFYYHVGYYLNFMLPTHKPNFLTEAKGIPLAIDFISRVFISFWIYQTITAFRRYGKK